MDISTTSQSMASRKPQQARQTGQVSQSDGRRTVRGVTSDVWALAVRQAEKQGRPVGDWLSDAIVSFSKSPSKVEASDIEGVIVSPSRHTDFMLQDEVRNLIDERLTGFLQAMDVKLSNALSQTKPESRKWFPIWRNWRT